MDRHENHAHLQTQRDRAHFGQSAGASARNTAATGLSTQSLRVNVPPIATPVTGTEGHAQGLRQVDGVAEGTPAHRGDQADVAARAGQQAEGRGSACAASLPRVSVTAKAIG